MLKNILSQTCVKNVYRLWVKGVVSGVNLSTTTHNQLILTHQSSVQTSFSTKFVNMYPLYLYTVIFRFLTDINRLFSTLSTAPIIKKMN